MVVLVENPAAAGIDLLVALVGSTHAESRVHVHVVTGHVEADQTLEDDCPTRPGGAQEDQQTSGCAAVSHHVQDCTEGGRLVEITRCVAIQRV